MLLAAAQRGVKINIIIYKEVTQALTRKYLSPTVPDYLHSLLPRTTNPILSAMSKLGLAATFASLEDAEIRTQLIDPPLAVSSSHTKHALEDLHPNIGVFRHPDHLPDAQTLSSSFLSSVKNLSLNAAAASKLPGDALKAIYGVNNDVVLYWAHHEKLCLIDGTIAFMGGLDLCYGRWDTNQHEIADAHPEDLKNIVFPGQDYNNARIMDFHDIVHWQDNKLDRTKSSRMGWSDLSLCLQGPAVEDLRTHFVHRWNFIYNEKYDVRGNTRYSRLTVGEKTTGIVPDQAGNALAPEKVFAPPPPSPFVSSQGPTQGSQYNYPPPPPGLPAQKQGQSPYFPPPPGSSSRGQERDEDSSQDRGLREEGFRGRLHGKVRHEVDRVKSEYDERRGQAAPTHGTVAGDIPCQIVRSCTKWSNGTATEVNISGLNPSIC
jgi:phospholipase D1/2